MDNKQEIISAIAPLFYKHGFWKVRVDDIAKELKISKRTLYVHFQNKKDIIRHVIQRRFDSVLEISNEAEKNNDNAVKALVELVPKFYGMVDIEEDQMHFEDLKKYYPNIYEEYIFGIRKVIQKVISTNNKRGKKEGFFKEEFDSDYVGSLFAQVYFGNRQDDFIISQGVDLKKIKRNAFKILLYGTITEKGMEELKNTSIINDAF